MKRLIFACLTLCSTLIASDITVVTMAIGDAYQKAVSVGVEGKRAYCQEHGYRFVCGEQKLDPDRHPAWNKILWIRQAMEDPECHWVFWTDADAVIMNQAVGLEELIDEDYNLILTKDVNGINTGQMLLRNCAWTRDLLDKIYARTDCLNHRWWEQGALIALLEDEPGLWQFIQALPQRLMNSYDWGKQTAIYQKGDFIVHFAGLHDLDELAHRMRAFASKSLNNGDLITLDYYLEVYGHAPADPLPKAQRAQFREALDGQGTIHSVVEIGFQGGRRLDYLLHKCPEVTQVTCFCQDYPARGAVAAYLKRKYGCLVDFIPGIAGHTIPKYMQSHPELRADLIHINGNNNLRGCLADIRNSWALAHEQTSLWIDHAQNEGARQAIAYLVREGFLEVLEEHDADNHCWVEARFLTLD
jgi:hypothetical protein